MRLHISPEGEDLRHELAFVIPGTAGIDPPVPYRRFKRLRIPFLQRICRLDIIMTVYQQGHRIFRDDMFTIHDRVMITPDDFDMTHACRFHFLPDKFCAFLHANIFCADALLSDDLEQFFKIMVFILIDDRFVIHVIPLYVILSSILP